MLHRDLRTLDADTLAEDLAESKTSIEGLTDRGCTTFAYPFGLSNAAVENAVAATGYHLAFGWSPEWKRPWRPMQIPRLPAPPRHGGRRLALKLLGVRRP